MVYATKLVLKVNNCCQPLYTPCLQRIQNFEHPFYIRKNESSRGHMELRCSSNGNERETFVTLIAAPWKKQVTLMRNLNQPSTERQSLFEEELRIALPVNYNTTQKNSTHATTLLPPYLLPRSSLIGLLWYLLSRVRKLYVCLAHCLKLLVTLTCCCSCRCRCLFLLVGLCRMTTLRIITFGLIRSDFEIRAGTGHTRCQNGRNID